MPTCVVNLKREVYDVYIGRQRSEFHFGNPFSSKESEIAQLRVKSVEEAVSNFRDWLFGTNFQWVEPDRRKWILENLETLRGKRLGCFCAPELCHGEIYLELLGEVHCYDLEKLF